MADDMNAMLLQALSGSGGAVAQNALLSQLDSSDPTVALLAQFLANRNAETTDSDSDDRPSPEEWEQMQQQLDKLSIAQRRLQSRLEILTLELEALQLRNDTLAAAMGACYLCWGTDPHCSFCRGKGLPGTFPLDIERFIELVVPAVRAYQRQHSQTNLNPSGLTNQTAKSKE